MRNERDKLDSLLADAVDVVLDDYKKLSDEHLEEFTQAYRDVFGIDPVDVKQQGVGYTSLFGSKRLMWWTIDGVLHANSEGMLFGGMEVRRPADMIDFVDKD